MKFERKNHAAPAMRGAEQPMQGMRPQKQQDGGEIPFLELTQALAEMEAAGELPEGFDLMTACSDRAFVELMLEFPAEAAVRIYAAEQRAAEAEQKAKSSVQRKMQQRAGLPKMSRAGGSFAAQPDYMSMSSEEFRKLEQQLKQASRAGRSVRI